MSFSTDVKSYLKKSRDNYKNKCCKQAFDIGVKGGEAVLRCNNCDSGFIAGVFYTYGTVNSPEKSSNLSICAPSSLLESVNSILEKRGLPMKKSVRNGKEILYVRKNSLLEDILTFMGASHFSVQIMEANVINDLKITANRINNADFANQDRASKASAEQLKAIQKLIDDKKLNTLSDEYVYTAKMRLDNPELSIQELAELFEPKISKSGLNHRLKKLIELSKYSVSDKE